MSNDNQQNKNAIIAVVLSGLVLFGWNYFFPQLVVTKPKVETKTAPVLEDSKAVFDTKVTDTIKSQEIKLSNQNSSVEFDNKLNLVNYSTNLAEIDLSELFKQDKLQVFISRDGKKTDVQFNFEKINDSSIKLSNTSYGLYGQVNLVNNELEISLNSDSPFGLGYKLSGLSENVDNQRFKNFVLLADSLETVQVGDSESSSDFNLNWFGFDHEYHLYSVVLPKKSLFKVSFDAKELDSDKDLYLGTMNLEPTAVSTTHNFKIVFVKKNYDVLKELGNNLHLSVDFGIWSIIAVPILRGLQYFYSLFNNYGISIIILTIVIRFLTFPLQYKSFKSMKKMQVVQPEIQKIKEKYKDNPQKMQQETMALFKKAGANPIGGCLPMLLQMPIFFAFYKVLYTSVELVDAPFYFWIADLSEKDPFYILPILMGVSMFLNMKLTPMTTADPAQQKVMMLMPVLFTFFMVNLPSGLTLYILVSTIVGMLQQLFVFKRTA